MSTRISLILLFILINLSSFAQCNDVCTRTVGGTWNCTGTATAPTNACLVVIPTGTTLTIGSNQVWNATVEVSGTLNLANQLCLGTSCAGPAGCGLNIIIRSGGVLNQTGPGNNERLIICGNTVLSTNPTADPDQQFPPGGFTGPAAWDEDGRDDTLPIRLNSFSIDFNDSKTSLRWSTIMEANFSRFVIERSQNGIDYEEIGLVNGAGRDLSNIETKYTFTDNVPLAGRNYYRLKAIDIDNSFEYFGPKTITINAAKTIAVFPNPTDGESLQVKTNFDPSEKDLVIVLNQLGLELYRGFVTPGRIEFNQKLAPGLYFVKYQSHNFDKVSTFLVKD